MSEVKRYFIHTTDLRNINDDWFHNVEMSSKNLWDSGQVVELVHKEDYEKLKAQLEKAESVLNKIQWLGHPERATFKQCEGMEIYRCSTCDSAERAREYFKEKEQV